MSSPRNVAALQAASDIEALATSVARALRFDDSPLQDTTHITPPPTSQIAASTQTMMETPQTRSLQQTSDTIKKKQLTEILSALFQKNSIEEFHTELLVDIAWAHFKNYSAPLKPSDFIYSFGSAEDCVYWCIRHDLSSFIYSKRAYHNNDLDEGLMKLIRGANRLVQGQSYFAESQTRLSGSMAWFAPVNAMILMQGTRITPEGTETRNFHIDADSPQYLIGNRARTDDVEESGTFLYDKEKDAIVCRENYLSE